MNDSPKIQRRPLHRVRPYRTRRLCRPYRPFRLVVPGPCRGSPRPGDRSGHPACGRFRQRRFRGAGFRVRRQEADRFRHHQRQGRLSYPQSYGTPRPRHLPGPRIPDYHPSQVARSYFMAAADTASRDVYLDAAPLEKPESGKGAGPARGGYYPGLAKGFIALARQEAFFREDTGDSALDLSAYFDGRDTSSAYLGVMCELLWAEFLSQDRPLETRYYLASALFPILDSLGWGRLQGMKKYLDVSPEAVREVADGMRDAIRNPKKLPKPKEVRKAKAPLELASQIASEYLSDGDLSEKAKDRFLAQWKKAWGREAPSFREDGEESVFRPNALLAKLANSKSQSPAAHYLKGRGLFAIRRLFRGRRCLGHGQPPAGKPSGRAPPGGHGLYQAGAGTGGVGPVPGAPRGAGSVLEGQGLLRPGHPGRKGATAFRGGVQPVEGRKAVSGISRHPSAGGGVVQADRPGRSGKAPAATRGQGRSSRPLLAGPFRREGSPDRRGRSSTTARPGKVRLPRTTPRP